MFSTDHATLTALRTARAVVQHWYEFAPEYGLDEWIDGLDRALEALPLPPIELPEGT